MNILLRGFIIGFTIAAPVGPIGVLCIRRTLDKGRISGLVSGLGAACADAIYGIIAGFGITFISSFLIAQQTWFTLFGGLYLCALGFRTYFSDPKGREVNTSSPGMLRDFFTIFTLTLTNPMTILSFAAIFASLGLAQSNRDYQTATLMVLGVFLGSASWWLMLSQGVGIFRGQVNSQWMRWINRTSGIILFTFGTLTLIKTFSQISPL